MDCSIRNHQELQDCLSDPVANLLAFCPAPSLLMVSLESSQHAANFTLPVPFVYTPSSTLPPILHMLDLAERPTGDCKHLNTQLVIRLLAGPGSNRR